MKRKWTAIGVAALLIVATVWQIAFVRGDGETGDASAGAVHPGTAGAVTQPTPANRGGSTFAILGDAAPVNAATPGYLKQAVNELNLLRPDLVFTTGNQVQGETRSVDEYAAEVLRYRGILAHLEMPAYFCAGDHDVESGTRDKGDRQFEALYQKYFGPLYYSVDFRDLHIITLDSEESAGALPEISDKQLAWLAKDLNAAFENGKISHVFIIVHRPLWREAGSRWNRVHAMLVEFNKRPIVAVEGMPGGSGAKSGPKVEAVFAGHERAFDQEPARDGIGYFVLGPLGARVDGDAASGTMQHYTMVHVDSSGVHVALVQQGAVLPDDFVTAHDREILTKIEAIDENTLGISGALEQPMGKAAGEQDLEKGSLEQVLQNPLDVPIVVQFRLASQRNLVTQSQKDAANPYTDNYDSPWELHTAYDSVHLDAGEKLKYKMSLYCLPQPGEVMPPQVEFVVNWIDSKGRSVPTVLKRRVPLIPSVTVPLIKGGLTPEVWGNTVRLGTYSWIQNPDDKVESSPDFEMVADDANLYVRIHVNAKRMPTYFANFDQPWNLPCDAISVAWAPGADTNPAKVQRIVVVWPTPDKPEILTNKGVGEKQTKLAKYAGSDAITATLSKKDDGYQVALTLLRALVLTNGSGVMNVTVTDNDGGATSTWRSWAREDLGPQVWGRVKVEEAPK